MATKQTIYEFVEGPDIENFYAGPSWSASNRPKSPRENGFYELKFIDVVRDVMKRYTVELGQDGGDMIDAPMGGHYANVFLLTMGRAFDFAKFMDPASYESIADALWHHLRVVVYG